MSLRRTTVATVALCFVLSASARSAPPTPPAPYVERVKPPGEGVLCAWGIYTAMASVGATCFPGENPRFQADLRAYSAQLEAYVVRNDKSATPQSIARFRREQGQTEAPAGKLCRADIVKMYRGFETADRQALMAAVAEATARDGKPSWGSCL
jgi:hypothetical protein